MLERGVLTIGFRHLRPQSLGTLTAAITPVKRNDLARLGIHGDPAPLLVCFLLHKAGYLVRFHFQALNHHVLCAGDRLDMEMIQQGLKALDQKPS